MTDSPPAFRSLIEEEMFFGLRKRERLAWTLAIGGMTVGLAGIVAVVMLLPLKQTEAFLTIVDKDTGVAERVVSVEDRKSTRLNSSHRNTSRMPSSA